MLPIGDPPRNKRTTKTESEELEKNTPSKWTGKMSQGNNTHIKQSRFQTRAIKKEPKDTS